MPFSKKIDSVRLHGSDSEIEVVGWKSHFVAGSDSTAVASFASSGQPAVVRRQEGQGAAIYCGFMPGLSYFRPALLPKRPVSRGPRAEDYNHFVISAALPLRLLPKPQRCSCVQIPTKFNTAVRDELLVGHGVPSDTAKHQPVTTNKPLVDRTAIVSRHGLAIPLIAWTSEPVQGLSVTLREPLKRTHAWTNASLAGGGALHVASREVVGAGAGAATRVTTFHLAAPLDVADAIVLR